MIEIGKGNKIVNCQIYSGEGRLIVHGKEVESPPTTCRNVTMIGNRVFINGYEYKNGTWKKTLRAIWHKYF